MQTALALFNEAGVAHVSTNLIAQEMDISPGNLYYHFRSKDDIVNALFSDYEQALLTVLAVPGERLPDLEDVWFFLHSLFEVIGHYRFIYRNFADVCLENAGLHKRLRALLTLKSHTATTYLAGLIEAGIMQASLAQRAALARNIVLITTSWLAMAEVLPLSEQANDDPNLAVWQVVSLVLPYLRQPEQSILERLALQYLRD